MFSELVTHNFIIMKNTQNFKHNYVNYQFMSLSKYREIKKTCHLMKIYYTIIKTKSKQLKKNFYFNKCQLPMLYNKKIISKFKIFVLI